MWPPQRPISQRFIYFIVSQLYFIDFMLQVIVIGNVGADAEKKNLNGSEFTTFRVAHNDRWKDQEGREHNNTVWVDCTLNGHPAVADYIKAGTQLAVIGTANLRVYSSAKDRCMKAGLQVSVRSVELLGGVTDAVPSRLYDNNGVQHDVQKFYHTDIANTNLMSLRGALFVTDANGWVSAAPQQKAEPQEQPSVQESCSSSPAVEQKTKKTKKNEHSEYQGENAKVF